MTAQHCYTYNKVSKTKCKNCPHLQEKENFIFKSMDIKAFKEFSLTSEYNLIVVCTKGLIKLTTPDSNNTITAQHMLIVSKNLKVNIHAEEPSEIFFMKFKNYVNTCPNINILTYKKYLDKDSYPYFQLPVHPTMDKLISLLTKEINLGPSCILFQRSKKLDFFSFLSMCYPNKDVAHFLYPLINDQFIIKELVFRYADKVDNVNELISLSGMSRTAFYQKFKEEYGISAKQWLLNNKAKQVEKRLKSPNPIIKEIRYEFGFNSSSQFNRFCKTYLGANPSEIIKSSSDHNSEKN